MQATVKLRHDLANRAGCWHDLVMKHAPATAPATRPASFPTTGPTTGPTTFPAPSRAFSAGFASILAAILGLQGTLARAADDDDQAAPAKPGTPDIAVIVAHPDDELVFAPALHRLAREGHRITLFYTTKGDQGPGVSGLPTGAQLAKAREAEARCAADALGVRDAVFLGLGDGTLGIEARKPGSSAKRLLAQMPELLDGYGMVITYGPEGGYGHSDHRMTGAVVTQHVQSLKAQERPELLYPAIIHGPLPQPLADQGWTLTAPDLASITIAYDAADLAAAGAAVQCYKTQFDEATRAMIAPGFDTFAWKGAVSFRPAF